MFCLVFLLFSLLIISYLLGDMIKGWRNRIQENLFNDRGNKISNAKQASASVLRSRWTSYTTRSFDESVINESESENTGTSEESRTYSKYAEPIEIPTRKESPVYSINKKRHRKCVIFNQKTFRRNKPRKGTEYDVEKIEQVFGEILGFQVVVHTDLKRSEVMEQIEKLCTEDHSDADCICIFILSHGGSGRIEAMDASYSFSEIWEPFLDCRTLVGKPKLFFVQAPNGNKMNRAHMIWTDDDSTATNVYTIPTSADLLFAYSTTDDYLSFGEENKGTWYIQSLCEVIKDHWEEFDLLKILTITSREVALKCTNDEQKQMPMFSSTLIRDFYFTQNN